MRKYRKRIVVLLLAVSAVISGWKMYEKEAYAQDNTLKIFMGDSTVARHHKAVLKGEETDELRFELKDKKVASSEYKSTNTSAFCIRNTTKGKCVVEALNEGTGHVVLTVKDEDGNKYVEKVFITVYVRIGNNKGIVNKKTSAYMGATVNAEVENYDNKGDITKGTELTISSQCGDFYLFRTLDGSTFKDGKDTGFIKKSDVNILTNSVTIAEECVDTEIGKAIQFSPQISPDFAANKSVDWSVDKNLATVGEDGSLIGNSQGTVVCTVTAKDGTGKSDSVFVSFYEPLEVSAGYLNRECDLYQIADRGFYARKGNQSANIEVNGECENYYRIRLTDFGEEDSGDFFVEKQNVEIPLLGIRIPETASVVEFRKKQLDIELFPKIATNVDIRWKTSNSNILQVDENGTIEGMHEGNAVVTAYSATNGEIFSKCRVTVEPYIAVTGIKITVDSDKIEKETGGTYKVEIFPANATYKEYEIYVEDKSMVHLFGNEYRGEQIGTTRIIAIAEDGGLSDAQTIEVTPIWVRKLELQKQMDLAINETKGMYGKITPLNATNKRVFWSVEDTAVAQVDNMGNVTGISCGTTVLHGVTEDGHHTASCKINVDKYVDEIRLLKPTLSLNVGTHKQLKIKVSPEDATKKDIKWRSKSNKIVTVKQDGTVTAKTPGSTWVIVYDRYKGAYDICIVNVSANLKKPELKLIRENGSNVLKWNKQKYATNYIIYAKKPGDEKYKKLKSVKSSRKTYELQGVTKGTDIIIKASCKRSGEQSEKSNTITVK